MVRSAVLLLTDCCVERHSASDTVPQPCCDTGIVLSPEALKERGTEQYCSDTNQPVQCRLMSPVSCMLHASLWWLTSVTGARYVANVYCSGPDSQPVLNTCYCLTIGYMTDNKTAIVMLVHVQAQWTPAYNTRDVAMHQVHFQHCTR